MNVESIADAVAAELPPEGGADCVVLFGSRARGTAREDSDVDLAVVGDIDDLALAAALSQRLGVDVDVVRIAHASRALLQSILRDGIPVYTRTRRSWGKLVNAAMLELELDRDAWERTRDAFLRGVAESGIGHG